MEKQQGFVNILVIVSVLMVIAGVSYFVLIDRLNISSSQKQPEATTNITLPEPPANVEDLTTKKESQKTPSPNTAQLAVISPNGGETLIRDSTTYTIKWSNPDRIGPLDIFLVKGGKIQVDIGFAPGAGATAPTSFIWKVDPIGIDLTNRTTHPLPDGNDYKIRISNQDGNIFDESDMVFSIVSQ